MILKNHLASSWAFFVFVHDIFETGFVISALFFGGSCFFVTIFLANFWIHRLRSFAPAFASALFVFFSHSIQTVLIAITLKLYFYEFCMVNFIFLTFFFSGCSFFITSSLAFTSSAAFSPNFFDLLHAGFVAIAFLKKSDLILFRFNLSMRFFRNKSRYLCSSFSFFVATIRAADFESGCFLVRWSGRLNQVNF